MNKPIRLVIVDDHEMIRQTWRMILERDRRIEVIAECSSGEEAIGCAEKMKPDVMLMDINMKPITGFEATRKIASNGTSVKIIGISINNQVSYARNMLQAGAKGYVTKNSTSQEMMEAILKVHEGRVYVCKDIQEKLLGKELI